MNREPEQDFALSAAFAADLLPPTPADLPVRVRRRLRRRRLLRGTAAPLAAVALLAALVWQFRPTQPEVIRDPRPAPPAAVSDVPEPAFLASAPPVDRLNALARHQAAFVTVLEQMKKEF